MVRQGAGEEQGAVSTQSPSTEAEGAVKSLDGRWFGGKMIKAEVYDEAKFDNNDLSH